MGRVALIKIVFVIFIVFLTGTSCSERLSKTELPEDKIVEIAEKKAKLEGITSEHHQIVSHAADLWKQKFGSLSQTDKERIISRISGRNYQVVLFALKPNLLGGDLWIFIDKETGEILILYGEE